MRFNTLFFFDFGLIKNNKKKTYSNRGILFVVGSLSFVRYIARHNIYIYFYKIFD